MSSTYGIWCNCYRLSVIPSLTIHCTATLIILQIKILLQSLTEHRAVVWISVRITKMSVWLWWHCLFHSHRCFCVPAPPPAPRCHERSGIMLWCWRRWMPLVQWPGEQPRRCLQGPHPTRCHCGWIQDLSWWMWWLETACWAWGTGCLRLWRRRAKACKQFCSMYYTVNSLVQFVVWMQNANRTYFDVKREESCAFWAEIWNRSRVLIMFLCKRCLTAFHVS